MADDHPHHGNTPILSPRRRTTAWSEGFDETAEFIAVRDGETEVALTHGALYRLVAGIDIAPVPMPAADVEALRDPFATSLLRAGVFPLTVADVLAQLDAAGVVPFQKSFLISEAGQIAPDTPRLERDMRFAIVRGASTDSADLLISAGAVGDPAARFLQIAAWDSDRGLFNYYTRVGGTWVWSGNSFSALSPGTRGQGCFDSHVNGSVVMKELKAPWNNWQSMNATIQLAPDDPLRTNPLYIHASGAEELELTIRAAVGRWTTARLAAATGLGKVEHLDWLLRQACTTTTVNLTSSRFESRALAATPERPLVPLTFFLNSDVLLDGLNIPADFQPPATPAKLYTASLHVRLPDGGS